jgi:tetratricopeptide (TPR) repeat protein
MASWIRAAQATVLAIGLSIGASAEAQDKPKETAEQLAEQGYASYEAGKYADAIGLYMKAFQISGDARLLYNVASIYDKKLHDRPLAEDFYRRYLRSTTTEPALVKKANERLTEMKNERETLRENSDAPARPGPAPAAEGAPSPSGGSSMRTAGLVVGVGGLALVGVGAGFGLSASSKADDVSRDCPNDRCVVADAVEKRDDASRDATLSTIFFGVGLAAVAGGTIMILVAPKSKAAALRLDLRANGAALAGTF